MMKKKIKFNDEKKIETDKFISLLNYNSTANCKVKFRGGAINAGRSE
jgi:hypothetical protein